MPKNEPSTARDDEPTLNAPETLDLTRPPESELLEGTDDVELAAPAPGRLELPTEAEIDAEMLALAREIDAARERMRELAEIRRVHYASNESEIDRQSFAKANAHYFAAQGRIREARAERLREVDEAGLPLGELRKLLTRGTAPIDAALARSRTRGAQRPGPRTAG